MNRFRFDYDLTFAVLMMHENGHTYARFGTQDAKATGDRMSIPGLKAAMRGVLVRHEDEKAPAPAPLPRQTVDAFPAFARTKAAKAECTHCHFANNARFAQLRLEGKFTKERLFQYPLPENAGITLDVDRNNRVGAVLPGSPAEKAGVQAGDLIESADGTPVLTSADLQAVLDPLPDPGSVALRLRRGEKAVGPLALSLPKGWRRTDISWRASQGDLAPTVGIWAEPLSAEQKRQRGLEPGRLGLRVSFMFPGPQWAKTRGDLRMNDVITDVNGAGLPAMTTRQFHSHFRLAFNVGDTALLNVLRGTERLEIRVPCLEVPEE